MMIKAAIALADLVRTWRPRPDALRRHPAAIAIDHRS